MEQKLLQAKIGGARVGRLATVDAHGYPHVIPICFAYDGRAFYTPVDLKPKRVTPHRLARIRHIEAHPHVALLIDEYQEDWKKLWYALVRGTATLLLPTKGTQYREAQRLLKAKYPQYAAGLLPADALLICILPARIVSWTTADVD